jgi:hypothetical protein
MVAIPIPEAPIACAAERHDFTRYHEDYHSTVTVHVGTGPNLSGNACQASGISSELPVTQPVRKAYIRQRRPRFNNVKKMLLTLGEY